MSLRRPARDSWDFQQPKRLARSSSPNFRTWTKSPRPELSSAFQSLLDESFVHESQDEDQSAVPIVGPNGKGDVDDDYPERLSLTPEPEDGETRGRTLFRHEEQDLVSPKHISTGKSPTDHVETPNITSPQRILPPKKVRFEEDLVRSVSLPPDMEYSSPIEAPNISANFILEDLKGEKAERDYLHSADFPIQFLRTVPNLNQMMVQLTPAMGDPGTGFTKFGPQSPQKSLFVEKADGIRSRDNDPLSQGFLKDRPITPHRPDRLPWETRTGQKVPTRSHGVDIRLSTAAEMRHDKATAKKWTGRKYSVNPNVKTRHMTFDILKRKINHHELLSLNLSVDARRDALKIGGGEGDIGGSAHSHDRDTSRSRERARQSSISTSTISSNRTSTFAARTKTLKQESLFEPPLCCNPACVHCQHHVPQAHAKQIRSHDQKVKHSDMISTGGWDIRERRLRAQDIDRSMDVGRYGFGGAMLWRLVRVAARVDVNGEEKDQHAWYVVPDKALGGFF